MHPAVRMTSEVSRALREGAPVVALESSVFAQGLPIPANREAADRMMRAVSAEGGVSAITAVVGGVAAAGLEANELHRFLLRAGIRKVSARDLPFAVASGADGATTVAGGLAIARLTGIAVFATGGIGGIHRRPRGTSGALDESADLLELSRTPMVVVCSGAKSILDLPATAERLETLGVPVIGYRTAEMPGFFTAETGIPVSIRVESAGEIAEAFGAHRRLGGGAAFLVVQPPPLEAALPRATVERAVAAALARGEREGIHGSAVTPYLLAEIEGQTGGASVGANVALLAENAALAARIAVALAAAGGVPRVIGDELSGGGIELARAGIVL